MSMTLIFEISIARAQKDILRGQKGIPGSPPSVRKVSLIICN